MAWEENSCICLHMQLITILSRIGVRILYKNLKIGKGRNSLSYTPFIYLLSTLIYERLI